MDAIIVASAAWHVPAQADVNGALDSITLLRATAALRPAPRSAPTNAFAVALADAISPALVYWPATAANHPLLHGNHLTEVLTACAALFGRPRHAQSARCDAAFPWPQTQAQRTDARARPVIEAQDSQDAVKLEQRTAFGSNLPYEDVPRAVRRCIDRLAQVLRTSLANRTSMALGPTEVITLLSGVLLCSLYVRSDFQAKSLRPVRR